MRVGLAICNKLKVQIVLLKVPRYLLLIETV
jgi:hypothetical protein